MRRMRKHVHDTRRCEAIAAVVHQDGGIARERRRVARDVDETRERVFGVTMRQRLAELDRALARGVDQCAIDLPERRDRIRRRVEQVRDDERRA